MVVNFQFDALSVLVWRVEETSAGRVDVSLRFHERDVHIWWGDRSKWSCYFAGAFGTRGNACAVRLVQYLPGYDDTGYYEMDSSGYGVVYDSGGGGSRWIP